MKTSQLKRRIIRVAFWVLAIYAACHFVVNSEAYYNALDYEQRLAFYGDWREVGWGLGFPVLDTPYLIKFIIRQSLIGLSLIGLFATLFFVCKRLSR